MKIKATKKEIRQQGNKIIGIGYCSAQYLLKYRTPFAYSTRVEGWACDYYNIDGVIISTGYAPLKNKNTKADYNMVKKYDNQAREIVSEHGLSYTEKEKQVNELLIQFVNESQV